LLSSAATLFFYVMPHPPTSTLFPYTTLFRSRRRRSMSGFLSIVDTDDQGVPSTLVMYTRDAVLTLWKSAGGRWQVERREHSMGRDRKSTRLNSSHVKISYAGFCWKKKKRRDS